VVTNTGDVALDNVYLDDNVFELDGLTGDATSGNSQYDIGILAAGASTEVIFNGATWIEGQHTNTASASGSYTDDANNTSNPDDSDDANYFGDALPTFTVTKTASLTEIREDLGGDVTYTITIVNTDDPNSGDPDPITINSLPDVLWLDENGDGIQQDSELQTTDRIGDALAAWTAAGNTGDIILAPGESFTFDYTVSYPGGNALNPWEDPSNTITANVVDDEGNEVSDSDDAIVDIIQKNQRSIEIDSLTGIRDGSELSGSFRIWNASDDPVDVKVDSLAMFYEEKAENDKGKKVSWLPTELSYDTVFWLESTVNGILDSDETVLGTSSDAEFLDTSIVFGSEVYVGYQSTFVDSVVPDPIKATAQASIDGRFDRFGEKVP
jgi:hypothetical protein